jgi:hypothetical protein
MSEYMRLRELAKTAPGVTSGETASVAAGFDYDGLPADERDFVRERALFIRELGKRTAESMRAIGKALTEVKERLPHGEWLPWLEKEVGCSDRTAERFMAIHQNLKFDTLSNLEIDPSALHMIAAPKTPEPARQKVIERAKSGERITRKVVAEIITGGPKPRPAREQKPQEPPDPILSPHQVLKATTAEGFEKMMVRLIKMYEGWSRSSIAGLTVTRGGDGKVVGVELTHESDKKATA